MTFELKNVRIEGQQVAYFLFPVLDALFNPLHQFFKYSKLISCWRREFKGIPSEKTLVEALLEDIVPEMVFIREVEHEM